MLINNSERDTNFYSPGFCLRTSVNYSIKYLIKLSSYFSSMDAKRNKLYSMSVMCHPNGQSRGYLN